MARFALKAEHLLEQVPRTLLNALPADPASAPANTDFRELVRTRIKDAAAGGNDLVSPVEALFSLSLRSLETNARTPLSEWTAALVAVNSDGGFRQEIASVSRVKPELWQEAVAAAGQACLRLYWLSAELDCKMHAGDNRPRIGGLLGLSSSECDGIGMLLGAEGTPPNPFPLVSEAMNSAILAAWFPTSFADGQRSALREMARRILNASPDSQNTPAGFLSGQRTRFKDAIANASFQSPKLFLKSRRIGECFHHGAVAALYPRHANGSGTQNYLEVLRQTAGEPDVEFQKKVGSQRRQRDFLQDVRADGIPVSNQDGSGSPNDNSINLELLCPRFARNAPEAHDTIFKAFVGSLEHDQTPVARRAKIVNLRNWLQNITDINGNNPLGPIAAPAAGASGPTDHDCVMIFTRNADKETHKNMTEKRLGSLLDTVHACGIRKVLICGDVGRSPQVPIRLDRVFRGRAALRCYDLREFWRTAEFSNEATSNSLGYQVAVHRLLYEEFRLWCLIGNRSGGMDGATLAGVPQICLDPKRPNRYESYTDRIGFSGICSRSWNSVSTTRGKSDDQLKLGFQDALSPWEAREVQLALVKCATVRADDMLQIANGNRYSFAGPKQVL